MHGSPLVAEAILMPFHLDETWAGRSRVHRLPRERASAAIGHFRQTEEKMSVSCDGDLIDSFESPDMGKLEFEFFNLLFQFDHS